MRASLSQTLRRQRSREGRHAHALVATAAVPAQELAEIAAFVATADPAVERVREAGGPVDEASYNCHCGFVFRAPVSTTVLCPHCRAQQAW
jgi:predicted Zn-ribbon and HTH transcriptional regulator